MAKHYSVLTSLGNLHQRFVCFSVVYFSHFRVLLNLLRLEYASRSDSWLHLVEDDVSWMRAHAGNWLTSMTHPFEPDWALDFARQQPKKWRRAVRQATYTSICQARLWSDLAAYRKQTLRGWGNFPRRCAAYCACTALCHTRRSEAASYAESTHCPICLVEFWSTQRLLVHFRSPSKHRDCLQVAERSLLPCDTRVCCRVKNESRQSN